MYILVLYIYYTILIHTSSIYSGGSVRPKLLSRYDVNFALVRNSLTSIRTWTTLIHVMEVIDERPC